MFEKFYNVNVNYNFRLNFMLFMLECRNHTGKEQVCLTSVAKVTVFLSRAQPMDNPTPSKFDLYVSQDSKSRRENPMDSA